jgi:arsenate reductase
MSVTLYGIPNCDTVRKARRWLDVNGIAHAFHDYKKQGIDAERLARWVDEAGLEKVLNRSGTTFRKLPEPEREGLDLDRATAVMLAHPSCIRRPIVEHPGGLLVGFDEARWAKALL